MNNSLRDKLYVISSQAQWMMTQSAIYPTIKDEHFVKDHEQLKEFFRQYMEFVLDETIKASKNEEKA